MTHTRVDPWSVPYVKLGISQAAFQEIRNLLEAAGYSHTFEFDKTGEVALIDMNGLALQVEGEN